MNERWILHNYAIRVHCINGLIHITHRDTKTLIISYPTNGLEPTKTHCSEVLLTTTKVPL